MDRYLFGRWLAPLIFFQLYLTAVGFLFFFGPWPWMIEHPGEIAAFLIAAQAFILCGYLVSALVARRIPLEADDERDSKGLFWLKVSTVVSLALAVPTSLARTGHLLPDVFGGITNPGGVYLSGLKQLEHGNAYVAFEYVRMLASPFLVAHFPLTVIFWRKAGALLRAAALVSILFYLAVFIGRGQNKGLADLIALLPFLLLAAWGRPALPSKRTICIGAFSGIALVLGFILFFGGTQISRIGGADAEGLYSFGKLALVAKQDYWLTFWMPESAQMTFESLARYLGQGYQAVALTYHLDHQSTLGAGHSMFLARNFDRALGTDLFTSQSLPALLEAQWGWPMYGLWHSIYPWLASDVGYFGALVCVGVFAMLLGISWMGALRSGSIVWVGMVSLMLTLFFYIPGNNQIFQSGETTVAFFMLSAAMFVMLVIPRRQRSKRPQELSAARNRVLPQT